MSTTPAPVLRAIGDLDSPRWGDERTRQVWLEGTAVGMQIQVDGAWLLATAMVWVGGKPLLGWGLALVLLAALAGGVATRYVHAYGIATPLARKNLRSGRAWALFAVAATFLAGAFRAMGGVTTNPSFSWGVVTGATAAVIVAVVAAWRTRRATTLPEDDAFDD